MHLSGYRFSNITPVLCLSTEPVVQITFKSNIMDKDYIIPEIYNVPYSELKRMSIAFNNQRQSIIWYYKMKRSINDEIQNFKIKSLMSVPRRSSCSILLGNSSKSPDPYQKSIDVIRKEINDFLKRMMDEVPKLMLSHDEVPQSADDIFPGKSSKSSISSADKSLCSIDMDNSIQLFDIHPVPDTAELDSLKDQNSCSKELAKSEVVELSLEDMHFAAVQRVIMNNINSVLQNLQPNRQPSHSAFSPKSIQVIATEFQSSSTNSASMASGDLSQVSSDPSVQISDPVAISTDILPISDSTLDNHFLTHPSSSINTNVSIPNLKLSNHHPQLIAYTDPVIPEIRKPPLV